MTLEDLVKLTTYDLNHERASNCKLLGIKARKNFQRFSFVIRGFEEWSKSKGHIVTALYPNLEQTDLKRGSGVTPMNSEVLVFCTCPAFLYWGSKYWSTQDGYNIKVHLENRPPYTRDPHKKRYVCKHVIRASRYMKKKGFAYLTKRFEVRKSSLAEASLEYDIKPAVYEFMRRKGMRDEVIHDFLLNMNEDNLELDLEEVGIYKKKEEENIPEQETPLDRVVHEDFDII